MPKNSSSPRTTLVVACLATAMLMLDVAVVNTAIAQLGRDLRVGASALKWIVDAYSLPIAATVITVGALSDRFGRRLVFAGGMTVFTTASLACALAPDAGALIAARVAQGLGASALFASSLALVADIYPLGRGRANAMAAYGATIGASFAVGPLVGGALASGPGWRWIFLVNIPIGLATLVATALRVRESRDPRPRRVDLPGLTTLTLGLFALVLALLRGREDGWTSAQTLAELGAAAGLIPAFLIIEARSAAPMLPLGLFRVRPFAAAQLASLALSASFFALYLYATLFLQDVLTLSPIQTGLVYLPGTALIFLTSAAAAPLGARIAAPRLIVVGLGLVAAGLALYPTVGPQSSWVAYEPGLLLASAGTGLLNPILAGLPINAVPAAMAGLASGVSNTARQTGIALGIAGLGALFSNQAIGPHNHAFSSAFHTAAFVGAGVALLGAATAGLLLRARTSTKADQPQLVPTREPA